MNLLISSFLLLSAIARIQAREGERARKLKSSSTSTLYAHLSPYPDYTGNLVVSGSVRVSFNSMPATELTYNFDIEGSESNCDGCGTHIHVGTTCDTDDDVGPHYFNIDLVDDQWTTEGGAVYNTDETGKGMGMFTVDNGYNVADNEGHTVVIHAQSGMRIGCGVLSSTAPKSPKVPKTTKAPKSSKSS
mmetsp:Transcript_13138/g.15443  ORF Transcript_13138/g.15443 Transcript_13138/m.15443 type:complete len:189 (+) Transcript_13138:87-653(+)|eukprot:CAMPEP_0198249678 /NCGR_PEP_ID=MMETSP1447-20131203/1122_1 /TAXON_ID=420782 /ORGANISM="Chaetoceros dichaeta, Strain CCMP1751" /LENGTH=188 /DNA_ID=CAMNT_0043934363 /DNA_START=58 /DNA_END=624 /DNA_ORIENTATION=+